MSHAHDRLCKRFCSPDPGGDLQHVRWQIATGHAVGVGVQPDGTRLYSLVVRGIAAIAVVAPDGFVKTVYPAETQLNINSRKRRRWRRRLINQQYKEKQRADKQRRREVQRLTEGGAEDGEDAQRAHRHPEVS